MLLLKNILDLGGEGMKADLYGKYRIRLPCPVMPEGV